MPEPTNCQDVYGACLYGEHNAVRPVHELTILGVWKFGNLLSGIRKRSEAIDASKEAFKPALGCTRLVFSNVARLRNGPIDGEP